VIAGRVLGNNEMMGEVSAAVEGSIPVVEARPLDARSMVLLHFDFVWRLLRRLGVEEADADDAAQQVFLVATRRTATIAPGSERAFLYGTALRMAATLRRNLRRRRRWVETRSADCASPEGTPHDELERRQALALLDEVLNELSDDLRVVFVLSELEELTTPEVASLVGVPTGTVASRLRRARKEFSTRLRRMQAQRLRQSW
jgi:RNA polymerase sigma-70 factor (ECF subfamily)